jgi:hypothetical protein
MTTKTEDPSGPDVSALRAAIATTDQLIAKHQQAGALMADLKRSLVLRLLHAQYPRLSIDEEAKLLKSYGVTVASPKK